MDPVSSDWKRNLLVTETYDGNRNRTGGLYYHADPQTNNWVSHWRYNYTYDGNGNRIEEVNYNWDSNTDNWINDSRNLITVDVDGNPTEEFHYKWDSQTDNWEYLRKAVHYYSVLTEIPDTTMQPYKESILVYPNPVSDYVTIEISDSLEISKIEIIDLYGRILRTTDNINSSSVTLQRGDLVTGIYILRIHAGEIYTKDIMVR